MPGIIDLQTNLRDLPYSADSKQPYVRTPIPAYNDPNPTTFVGEDTIGRTGALAASLTDVGRITEWGLDKGGLLFLVKQQSLTLANPKTFGNPTRIYNPANTLAQIGANGITGTHFVKDGVGFDISSEEKYEYVVRTTYNGDGGGLNRLTALRSTKLVGEPNSISIANATELSVNRGDEGILLQYLGGPNSVGGIGQTQIKRTSYTEEWANNLNSKPQNKQIIALTHKNIDEFYAQPRYTTGFGGIDGGGISNFTLVLNGASGTSLTAKKRILGRITPYDQFNRRAIFGVGDIGTEGPEFDRQAYYEGSPISTEGVDLKNFTPIYKSDEPEARTGQEYDDLIKFYFAVLDNNDPSQKTYVHLRAYLTQFSDSHQAQWNSFKYMGRGENFYRYEGYDRNISVGFRSYVHSRIELLPVYNKLNYLASVMAPDYSTGGFMRGNIVYLTIGDYIVNTPGIMENIEYQIPEESSWELARKNDGTPDTDVGELPLLVDVSFNFKPIHDFLPRTVTNLNNPESKFISKLTAG